MWSKERRADDKELKAKGLRVDNSRLYALGTLEKFHQICSQTLEKFDQIAQAYPKLESFSKAWCSMLYAFWIIFCFCLTDYAECYTLSIGHFSPSPGSRTFLVITDLSGLGPDVEINFYDDTGHLVSISRKLLPPKGKIQIPVDSYLHSMGNIIVESSNEQIAGEYWQVYEGNSIFMLPLQSPVEEKRYFVNCFRFQYCTSNFLVISDPYGAGPIVQMEFYNQKGELIKVASNPIKPYGVLVLEVNDYAPWDILGKVSIRSFRGGIALHYRQLCGNEVVYAAPARLPARELLIDKLSIGTEIKSKSSLVIIDTSAEGPTAKIQFLSERGVSTFNKLLPPNGTVVINLADYINESDSGIIQITSGAGIIADYWERNSLVIRNVPAVRGVGSILFISYFSPFDNTQNLLSFFNVGQESVKAEIQFYNSAGKELGGKELLLEPHKQVDELVDYYFAGLSLGTIIVKSPSSLLVTSHTYDLRNNRRLGGARAQIIR